MKEIITDLSKLGDRADEIDIRKENDLMREIIVELKDTLRSHKDGVGLAAPQIGYEKRIFVINFNGDIRSFINPIITKAVGMTLNREGCLSLPGKEFIRPRNTEIEVTYQTPLGKIESRKIFGLAACVFQHELDHLDGLTLADIGQELPENFDSLSEDEKNKLINDYLDSLDLKQKEVQKEIEESPELKQTADAIKFIEAVQKGDVKVESRVIDEKTSEKITEKLKEINNNKN